MKKERSGCRFEQWGWLTEALCVGPRRWLLQVKDPKSDKVFKGRQVDGVCVLSVTSKRNSCSDICKNTTRCLCVRNERDTENKIPCEGYSTLRHYDAVCPSSSSWLGDLQKKWLLRLKKHTLHVRYWRGLFKDYRKIVWLLQQRADLQAEAGCGKRLRLHTEVSVTVAKLLNLQIGVT